MRLLDGRPIAQAIRADTTAAAKELHLRGIIPTLAIVLATDDPQAAWYVRSIGKAAKTCEIESRLIELGSNATSKSILNTLSELAKDTSVHGIILQTPLPPNVVLDDVLPHIPPAKDVDGASPHSAGQIMYGEPAFPPATAEAAVKILEHYDIPFEGAHTVVVGRSRIVGKPVAHLLLEKNATVTICHTRTADLAMHTKQADILVVAAGKPGLITAKHVGAHTIVIDVGTNVTDDGQLVGDVDQSVRDIASAVSPVPGGVGPVTTALLLQHTVLAAKKAAA